jgi:hypothetical protein
MSAFCSAESPYRLPCLINTTSNGNHFYQMVLHRSIELARQLRQSRRFEPPEWVEVSDIAVRGHYD